MYAKQKKSHAIVENVMYALALAFLRIFKTVLRYN